MAADPRHTLTSEPGACSSSGTRTLPQQPGTSAFINATPRRVPPVAQPGRGAPAPGSPARTQNAGGTAPSPTPGITESRLTPGGHPSPAPPPRSEARGTARSPARGTARGSTPLYVRGDKKTSTRRSPPRLGTTHRRAGRVPRGTASPRSGTEPGARRAPPGLARQHRAPPRVPRSLRRQENSGSGAARPAACPCPARSGGQRAPSGPAGRGEPQPGGERTGTEEKGRGRGAAAPADPPSALWPRSPAGRSPRGPPPPPRPPPSWSLFNDAPCAAFWDDAAAQPIPGAARRGPGAEAKRRRRRRQRDRRPPASARRTRPPPLRAFLPPPPDRLRGGPRARGATGAEPPLRRRFEAPREASRPGVCGRRAGGRL